MKSGLFLRINISQCKTFAYGPEDMGLFMPGRNSKRETASFSGCAIHRQGPPVDLNQVLANEQAQACSFFIGSTWG